MLVGDSGLAFSRRINVWLPELGQGQKASTLIEPGRHQNKEMNKADIIITSKRLVFLNNVSKVLFIIMHRSHTIILLHFYLHTLWFKEKQIERQMNKL